MQLREAKFIHKKKKTTQKEKEQKEMRNYFMFMDL